MAYIKYKEITKYFNFSKIVDNSLLPKYTMDYVFENEKVLAAYKTRRDYGVFTDKKIILMSLFMNSGYPVRLKFVNMSSEAKYKLRVLYSYVSKYVIGQPVTNEEVKKMQENDFKFNE